MCFNNDYDWTASVVEYGTRTLTKPVKCEECSREIAVGQTAHTIYMQEHEECQACANGECMCSDGHEDGHDCKCAKPKYGEDFDYLRCDECDKFLKAVEAAEVDAGCSRSESRPTLQNMRDEIHDGGRDEARKYFKTAKRMFPELVASGFLGWLWRWTF